jgi:hypothetical protein
MIKVKLFTRIIAAFMVIVAGISCKGDHKRHHRSKKTFFDSIAAQMPLSFGQVHQHAKIDSAYFTAKSEFTGDTIYYPTADFVLAIIRNDDHSVCSYKFLAVYNTRTKENTACQLVETGCDEDYSTDFTQLSFKIFNKKQFFTRLITYVRNPDKKTKVEVKDSFFQIDANGQVHSLDSAPKGVKVPVYVQPDNIDDTDDDSLNRKP